MNDQLRERIARIDPIDSGVPTDPTTTQSSQELLEKIMSTSLEDKTERTPAPRRTWTIAIAAVAALVLAVAAGLSLGDSGQAPVAEGPALELSAGGEDVMASCIVFSPEELDRVAEIAFAGTVTSLDGETVTLSVDEWYRGEEVAIVELHAPQGMEALIGGIPFQVDGEYLISAQAGSVNYCGFSGPLTPDYQTGFEAAFANG